MHRELLEMIDRECIWKTPKILGNPKFADFSSYRSWELLGTKVSFPHLAHPCLGISFEFL